MIIRIIRAADGRTGDDAGRAGHVEWIADENKFSRGWEADIAVKHPLA